MKTSHKKLLMLLLVCLVACEKAPEQAQKQAERNVILISIDTLRPDALSIYGSKTATPFFDQFAKKSAVFDHAFTCAPLTLPAHTSLLTGLYPPSHGVRNNGTFHVPQAVTELSEIAKQNGAKTAAVVGGFPLGSQFGLNQGFDVYDDSLNEQPTGAGGFLFAEKNAEAVRASAESWLSKNKQGPFFLWLHFFDPHHPYLDHGMKGVAPYQQEVVFVDAQIAAFFDFLKKNGLEDSTLMIVTADHGEAFGEHGEVSHSIFVYNTTLRIPLLISRPHKTAARITNLVRIIDVAPTIVELMGWKNSSKMDGVSLVPLLDGKQMPPQQAYAETLAPALDFGWAPLFSIQDLHSKLIQAPRSEYYRLDSDPGEKDNFIAKADTASLSANLRKILNTQNIPSENRALSPEEREKLASLGYFSSGQSEVRSDAPDPKDKIDVARNIAALTEGAKSLPEQAALYRDIVAREPRNPLLKLRYAEVLLQIQDYAEARKNFLDVESLGYPSADVYNGLASTYFFLNQVNDAEKALREAVNRNLADGETYYNLGEIEMNRGEREKAFEEYDRSMSFRYLRAFYRKARLVEIMQSYQDALKILGEAESIAPAQGQPNYEKGLIYYRHDRLPESIDQFKIALQKDPNDVDSLYDLGLTYSKVGDQDQAKKYMRQFLAKAPPELKDERKFAQQVLK